MYKVREKIRAVLQEKIKKEEIFSSKGIFKKGAKKYSSMIPEDSKGEKQLQSSQRKRKPKVIEEASKNQKMKKTVAKSQQKQKNKQIISREQLVQNEEVNIGQQKTYEITNYQADFMKMFKKFNLGSLETELQQQLNKKKPMVSTSFHQIYLGTVQSIQNERSKQQQQAGVAKPIEEKQSQNENTDQLFENIKKKHKTLEKVQELLFKSYDHQEENLEKIDSNLKDMKSDTMCKIIDDIIIKNPSNQNIKQQKASNTSSNGLNTSMSLEQKVKILQFSSLTKAIIYYQKPKKKLIGLEGGLDKVLQELENHISISEQKVNKRDYFNQLLLKFDIQNPDIIIDQNGQIPNSQEKMILIQEFIQNGNTYDLYKVPTQKPIVKQPVVNNQPKPTAGPFIVTNFNNLIFQNGPQVVANDQPVPQNSFNQQPQNINNTQLNPPDKHKSFNSLVHQFPNNNLQVNQNQDESFQEQPNYQDLDNLEAKNMESNIPSFQLKAPANISQQKGNSQEVPNQKFSFMSNQNTQPKTLITTLQNQRGNLSKNLNQQGQEQINSKFNSSQSQNGMNSNSNLENKNQNQKNKQNQTQQQSVKLTQHSQQSMSSNTIQQNQSKQYSVQKNVSSNTNLNLNVFQDQMNKFQNITDFSSFTQIKNNNNNNPANINSTVNNINNCNNNNILQAPMDFLNITKKNSGLQSSGSSLQTTQQQQQQQIQQQQIQQLVPKITFSNPFSTSNSHQNKYIPNQNTNNNQQHQQNIQSIQKNGQQLNQLKSFQRSQNNSNQSQNNQIQNIIQKQSHSNIYSVSQNHNTNQDDNLLQTEQQQNNQFSKQVFSSDQQFTNNVKNMNSSQNNKIFNPQNIFGNLLNNPSSSSKQNNNNNNQQITSFQSNAQNSNNNNFNNNNNNNNGNFSHSSKLVSKNTDNLGEANIGNYNSDNQQFMQIQKQENKVHSNFQFESNNYNSHNLQSFSNIDKDLNSNRGSILNQQPNSRNNNNNYQLESSQNLQHTPFFQSVPNVSNKNKDNQFSKFLNNNNLENVQKSVDDFRLSFNQNNHNDSSIHFKQFSDIDFQFKQIIQNHYSGDNRQSIGDIFHSKNFPSSKNLGQQNLDNI
ncbi:hypothetical protein ABPG74_010395 [Tetrahymena malaccensis]